MGELWRKWTGWLRRDSIQAELEEEMRTHLEMKAAAGAEANAARRQFGNTTILLEESRDAWSWPRPEAWLRDLGYGLRMMARRPGFAATVVLTLGLGIGASGAIFSLIDTVLIRPLAYPDSGRLVSIREAKLGTEIRKFVAPGRLDDWQRLSRSFEALGAVYDDTFTASDGSVPERVRGAAVSPGFFSALGTPPQLGRVLTATEERFGGPLAVVISEGFWRRRFGGDRNVIGRTLLLSGRSYVIAGVMPPSFQYPAPATDLWAPAQAPPGLLRVREARFYNCVGRLRPGVTIEQATADLDAVQKILGEQYPKTDAGWGVDIEPLKDRIVGGVRRPFVFLFGSAALLLLITCANVACLLLGQLNTRVVEIATRCALGAGRDAIARQLLAEGVTYALAGGGLGVIAVLGAVEALRRLPQVPRITELEADGRALALIAAVSLGAAVVFSLAPILQTFRRDAGGLLIRAGRGVIGRGQRLPRLLVSSQLALATVLLIGAGLFLQSLARLQSTPLGFQPDRVLALRVTASYTESPAASMQRHQRTLDALAALPGVSAVSMSAGLPGVNPAWPTDFEIAGEADNGTKRYVTTRVVTSAYFRSMGIALRAGETCRMNPGPEPPFEALVNRKLVDRYLAGRNPIGRTIREGQMMVPMKIQGVVEDVREDGFGQEPEPLIYVCGYLRYWPDSDFIIRTAGDPAALANAAREAVRSIDPGRAVYSVRPLTEALDGTLSQNRFRALVVSLFSALALALAAIGLYGIMAYMVTQRTREIGIRVAMGARPGQIISDILLSGGRLTVAGAIVGIGLAAILAKLAGAVLYGVQPFETITYLTAGAVLFAVALLACLIPGRRALAIDPATALRDQ